MEKHLNKSYNFWVFFWRESKLNFLQVRWLLYYISVFGPPSWKYLVMHAIEINFEQYIIRKIGHSNVSYFSFGDFICMKLEINLGDHFWKIFGAMSFEDWIILKLFLGLWLILLFKILEFLDQHIWEPKFSFKDKLLLEWDSVCNFGDQF